MKSNQPPRLRDHQESSPLLRLALTSRDDEPSSGDLDALGARLGLSLVPPAHPPAATAGTTAAGVVKSKLVSMLIGPVLVGALAGTAFVQVLAPARTAAPPAASMERSSPTVVSTTLGNPRRGVAEPEPRSPASSIADPEVAPNPADPPRRPRRVSAVEPTAELAPSEPTPSEPTLAPPVPIAPETEVALLQRAKALVATDARSALALADEHALRFPNGMLEQEAEVIALEALVAAGRTSDAAHRLARFRTRFPKSAHLPHLESVVRLPK